MDITNRKHRRDQVRTMGKERLMDQAQEKSARESGVAQVFKELGLETSEQRDKFTAQSSVVNSSPPVRYVIRLSNSSQPSPTVG